ncbi:ribose ABC transporter permease [Halodesulfovibrio spirochaetisodalis]|uniref:Ribose ABC transporter permease n=1 Tax=Halodesulfovibrio spirochaetisodalis TaxID=1560234 RepID=A0A1B7XMS7_9BACT|nr:ribose ABC transporter permease [Halodesulfovibrio spirochaetisodalis]OBQ56827.1 ribose ABC transporter permease [Halodesulfovibrio spirochaetisodalis]
MTTAKKTLTTRLIEQKTLIALIIMVIVVSLLNPNFFTTGNILNTLRQTAVNAIIAVGMTMVILTAGIDLSVGSILALCGAISASLIASELPVFIAVTAALAAGAIVGGFSGIVIAKGKVQAFIATLVSMTLVRGLTLVYTDGRPISTGFTDVADSFAFIGTGHMLGIPVPIWIMAFTFLAAWYLLNHTRLGRYIYALGGNEAATRLSGINVDRIKIAVYSMCGLLSALAGLIVTSRLSSAQPTAGAGYELDAIAAVVLGGTSLMGGKGTIIGTLLGALIIGVLNNALNLLDVSSYYQMIAKALVILLAVLIDTKSK